MCVQVEIEFVALFKNFLKFSSLKNGLKSLLFVILKLGHYEKIVFYGKQNSTKW